jgi:predicted ATPase with chaperone activity
MSTVTRYQRRISGPLLDRIDIHVEVPWVDYQKLTDDRFGEPSKAIREQVERAREVQRERFADTSLSCNADMGPGEVREVCQLDEAGRGLVKAAMLAGAKRPALTWLQMSAGLSPHPQTSAHYLNSNVTPICAPAPLAPACE